MPRFRKIAWWAGLRAVGRASPPTNRYGGQGRPPHQHQLFCISHGIREEMIVGIKLPIAPVALTLQNEALCFLNG
jgi:hypothetical protein